MERILQGEWSKELNLNNDQLLRFENLNMREIFTKIVPHLEW